MNLFRWLGSWFAPRRPWEPARRATADVQGREPGRPAVHFASVSTLDRTPANSDVVAGRFYVVAVGNDPYWALFRCPCGCGEVINLAMRPPHNPRWSVRASKAGRPDLRPSVWRNKGCASHFWVEDGRIYWCGDNGREPSVARPDLYRRPSEKPPRY